jgi:hypothetical protein
MVLLNNLSNKLLANECDMVLLPATNIMDLSTRTNKINIFVQNNLGGKLKWKKLHENKAKRTAEGKRF